MGWFSQRFELSRGSRGHNLRTMEGLRGLAIFLVFWVHYVSLVEPWVTDTYELIKFAHAMHAIGNVGVDLFFVLSGYLIYGSLISRPQEFGHFIGRRIRRIYPAFGVIFAVYVVLSFIFASESKIPSDPIGAGVYLLQNLLLLPGIFPIEPMITVAWSLSYEMFYYLAIPLLIGVMGLHGRSVTWRIVFFVSLVLVMLGVGALWGGPVRLVMFVAGIVLYEVNKLNKVTAPSAWIGMMALVLGLLSTLLPIPGSAGFALRMALLFIAFFVLCLACFRDGTSWLARLFGWTPLRWLGNMSYSYYLLHGLALKFAFLVLGAFLPATGQQVWLFWLMLPILFGWTLLPCVALFLVVERPYSLVSGR